MKVSDVRTYLKSILAYNHAEEGGRFADKKIVRGLLRVPFSSVRSDEFLSEEDVEALKETLKERWEQVHFTEQSYNRCQSGQNLYWIRLANALAKIVGVDKSCYHLLMPTVENEEDEALAVRFDTLPLHELIVSDDGKRLISLQTVVANAESRGRLAYVHAEKELPLSQLEIERFKYTNQTMWLKYQKEIAPSQEDNERITTKTVLAVKRLAEDSVFDSGASGDYSSGENTKAQMAYKTFIAYLETLTEEERQGLMSQQIISSSGQSRSFAAAFNDAVYGYACITYMAKYYCQLVTDYIEGVEWDNTRLNKWKDTENWQALSKKKTFSKRIPLTGYDESSTFYRTRCEQLLLYIMSCKFDVYLGGTKVYLGQQYNTVSSTAVLIHEILISELTKGEYRKAYFDILENIVKPACEHSSIFRTTSTSDWLTSINNGDFWSKEPIELNINCIGAKVLCLLKQASQQGFSTKLDVGALYDRVILLLLDLEHTPSKRMELLVIASKLSESLSATETVKLNRLLQSKQHYFASDEQAKVYIKERLVCRYVYHLSHVQGTHASFFGSSPMTRFDEDRYFTLKTKVFADSSWRSDSPEEALKKASQILSGEKGIHATGVQKATAFLVSVIPEMSACKTTCAEEAGLLGVSDAELQLQALSMRS